MITLVDLFEVVITLMGLLLGLAVGLKYDFPKKIMILKGPQG
jgi:hypothetical protein